MYQQFFLWGILSALSVITGALPTFDEHQKLCSKTKADIIFVLDSSSSIWIVDYKKQLKFVEDVVDSFNIGRSQNPVRVGAITFSDHATLEFSVDRYQDSDRLKEAISNIAYRQGRTNTADALKLLKEQAEKNMENNQRTIIAIVITDGRSTDPVATKAEAKKLHNLGINVYAIGVGDSNMYDINELKAIASDPNNGVYTVSSYSALKHIAMEFNIEPCEEDTTPAPPPTTPAPTTTTTPAPTTRAPAPTTTTTPAPTTTTTTPRPTTTTTTPAPTTTTEQPVHTEPVKKDPTSVIIFGFDMVTMGHYRTPMFYQFINSFLPLSGYGRFSVLSFAYCPDTFNVPMSSLMHKDPYAVRNSVQVGVKLPGLVDIVNQMQGDMEANILRNPVTGQIGNRVVVLFVDPIVTVITPELINATNALKRQGVRLFMISVGQDPWFQTALSYMSSQPFNNHVFNYPTYDELLYSVRKTPFRFRAMCNQYINPPSLYGIRV